MNELEESSTLSLDFGKASKVGASKHPVLPVVLQNALNGEVLYLAYMNDLALEETMRTGAVVLWSTSRDELWRKGDTSGDVLDLVEVRVNCEQNSLLVLCVPRQGSSCHTKDSEGRNRETCYYRALGQDAPTGTEMVSGASSSGTGEAGAVVAPEEAFQLSFAPSAQNRWLA